MILAYALYRERDGFIRKLAIVPHKEGVNNPPFPIDLIRPSTSAVYSVGPEEGLVASTDPDDNGLVLEAYNPAVLYLTPNTANRPGVKVNKVKLFPDAENEYLVYFLKEMSTKWEQWDITRPRG